MLDHDAAVASLADPGCPQTLLAQIAGSFPDLWGVIATHPNAYPGLLDWLWQVGDGRVRAVVEQERRRRQAVEQASRAQSTPQPPMNPGRPVVTGPDHLRPDQIPPGVAPSMPASQAVPPGVTPSMPASQPVPPGVAPLIRPAKSSMSRALDSITGSTGEPIVRFQDLFRDTFHRHSRADLDALMYAGTAAGLADRRWRLPWLYARVFLVLLSAFVTLWLCMLIFADTSSNVVPGVIFTGSLVVPATVMVFFWEFDQSRAVSLFDILRTFFIGGAVSILLTFVGSAASALFRTGDSYGVSAALAEAAFIGFTEEVAKAIVIFVLVRRLRHCLISNGLLIGAVVGTGFAVFETMGYGTSSWFGDVVEQTRTMEYTLFLRGILSLGGHVVWAAIIGAAIMIAQRPDADRVQPSRMDWGKFIALFCVPFLLHTLWDFISLVSSSILVAYTLMGALIVVAWVFIVRLINSGLRQYAQWVQNPALGSDTL
jgi:RsiW-degrading membrane proteinase PrsW (M82 family)